MRTYPLWVTLPMHLHVIRIARMYGIQLVRMEHITGVSSVSSWTRLPVYAHRAQSGPLHDRFTHFCHPCWRPRLPPPSTDIQTPDPIGPASRPHDVRTVRTHMHACTAHMHISSHTRTQTYTQTYTHAHIHTQTQTHTHTHIHTHANPYIHTHQK